MNLKKPVKKIERIFLSLLALTLLVSCDGVVVPNTEICAVAGLMSAGADCAKTLSPDTRSITLDEFIKFLEPQEEIKDGNGNIIQKERGPAICQSSTDWNAQKTALEIACKKLGSKCTYEIQQALKSLENIDALTRIKRRQTR